MEKGKYHHGNLREAMIDASISIINNEGLTGLSLRKVAKECEVSHNAPYKHFENKDNLLLEIKTHISNLLTKHLESILSNEESNDGDLLVFGVEYVMFFIEHPDYYKFLFNQPHFHLKITSDSVICDDFEPFNIFILSLEQLLRSIGICESDITLTIITMLSVVDGLSSLLTSKNVVVEGDKRELVSKILRSKLAIIN
jgi:AcrR family transcriptional regulator